MTTELEFTCFHPRRRHERGGITILIAIVMLSVVTISALSMGRESLRDLMITGNESTGRKAFETADSGLDWVINWGSPYADVSGTPEAATLHSNMNSLLDAIDTPAARTSAFMDSTGTLGTSMLADDVGGELKPSTADYLQKSQVRPSFDVEVRYLGPMPLLNTGAGGFIKGNRSLWLVRTTGRANVVDAADKTLQSFRSRREAIVEYIN